MSTTALISVEEYLGRTEKPNAEYIDGVVYPKAMPTTPHAQIQWMMMLLLHQQGMRALPEVSVRLSATKYLVPDVVAGNNIGSPYPTEPVLLCAEILSPEDRVGAMLAKCEQYHSWGVPYCWVVDPVKQTAWEYHLGGEPNRVDRDGTLRAGELNIRLSDLFKVA